MRPGAPTGTRRRASWSLGAVSDHVLVAMGRSEASAAGLEYALEECVDATVSVVHVVDSSAPLGIFESRDPDAYVVAGSDGDREAGGTPDPASISRTQRRRAESLSERVGEIAARRDVDVDLEIVVRSGEAVSEIVACAETRDVDRVVIAEHPRTGLRPLLRTVPEAVASATDCPVTIVP